MATTPPYIYKGTAYKQTEHPDAPWILDFVAPVSEILAWAGIPRRSNSNMTGFQRAFEPSRVTRARDFFKLGPNQSPTSLIIGIHPTSQQIVSVSFEGDQPLLRSFTMTIQFDSGGMTAAQIVQTIREQIAYRLKAEPIVEEEDAEEQLSTDDQSISASDDVQTVSVTLPDQPSDAEVTDSEAGESEAAEGEDEKELELGKSLLRKLLDNLNDPQWVNDYLDDLRDLAKPATIIDGQHRALGALQTERYIPFSVCALSNCDWQEQVFQFTVVNYTAEGIPDQFITANAGLSLTESELKDLTSRLVQAGVKVIEYDLMSVVNFDKESPFFELVNLSEKASAEKIGYKTMVQVAKRWYNAKHPALKQLLLPNIYPHIKKPAQRLARWHERDWGSFFKAFWSVVYAQYRNEPSAVAGSHLWDVGHSNLMAAVVLFELQEEFLDNLNAQDEEFFVASAPSDAVPELLEKIRKRAEKFVEWFPPKFFASNWALKSLNVGPGRQHLKTCMDNFAKTKGKYQYDKSALVSGQTEGQASS